MGKNSFVLTESLLCDNSGSMTKPIRKVVFPVGGLGTRFLPATKSLPKEMLPVVDKPLIHYAFEEALEAGIEQFIFVTGRNKNAINNHFDHAYELQNALTGKNRQEELDKTTGWLPEAGDILFIRQQQPLGLGHAIWCARNAVGDEPFAVILADDLIQGKTGCLKQMIAAYRQQPGCNMVAAMEVAKENTRKYGILDISSESGNMVKAKGLVEKPEPAKAPSSTAVIGRYILQAGIFGVLSHQQKGAGGEIQITDALNKMAANTPTYGLKFEGKRFDCGERAGYMEANIAFAMEQPDMRDTLKEFMRQYV